MHKISQVGMSKDEKNKAQNLDYVIRSGLAGGMAGCMVTRDCFDKVKSLKAERGEETNSFY